MKSLLKTNFRFITTSVALMLLSACSSTDKNAPVEDDYDTSYYWSEHRSDALNLLTSANMANKYSDVNSKEDISDIRDRNSTAGNLLGNVLNTVAFGVMGGLYSVSQNDDDIDPRFASVTYVTYIPVDSDNLSPKEQLIVRNKAIENITATLLKAGSDKTKFTKSPRNNGFYHGSINGEICDVTRPAYENTRFYECFLAIKPEIKKVFELDELPPYLSGSIKSPYVATVSIILASPLIGVAMAKSVQKNDFIAIPDLHSEASFKVVSNVPVVVQNGEIYSYFKPRHKVNNYKNGECFIVVYFKETKTLFKMPIVTGDTKIVMTELSVDN